MVYLGLIGIDASLTLCLKVMNRFMHAEDPAYFRVPDNKQEIGCYLDMFYEGGEPCSFDTILDADYKETMIYLLVVDSAGPDTVRDLVESVKEYVEKNFNNKKVEANICSGTFGFLYPWNKAIAKWVPLSCILSAIVVFIFCSIFLRSIPAALFFMIPVIWGTVISFSIYFFHSIEVNWNTMITALMAIGIGIDSGVYLMFRFREEFPKSKDFQETMSKVFTTTGKALVYSCFASILGCLAFTPIPIFVGHIGYVMGMTLLANCLATFIVLVACWSIFEPKRLFN